MKITELNPIKIIEIIVICRKVKRLGPIKIGKV